MEQLHFKKVPLEEIVHSASLIVVGKACTSLTTSKSISVTEGSKEVPPYFMTLYHFQVIQTLYSSPSFITPKKLVVVSPYWETNFKLHKDYYLKGLSRHVQMTRYDSGISYEDLKQVSLILFLQGYKSPARFVVEDSYESVDKIESVIQLIKKLKDNAKGNPTITPRS